MNLLPLAVGGAFLLLTRRGGHPKAPPPSTQPAAGGAPAGPAPSATAAATPRTSVATLQEAGPAGGTAAAAGVPRLLTAPRLARHWHLASPVCALLASCATLALCCALGLLLRPPPLAVALLARLAALCSLASALVALKALRAKPPARRRAGASALAAGGAASLVGRLAAPAAPLTDDEWLAQARATPHELALLAPRLHGYFRRDAAASDDMGPAMDLVHMPFLLRKAIVLIDEYRLSVRSKLPWFKIREAYPASGEARRHTRRDLRGGGALGRAAVTPDGVRLVSHWGEPFAGCERAVYSLSPDGATFTADATITMAGAAAGAVVRYRTIYRKA